MTLSNHSASHPAKDALKTTVKKPTLLSSLEMAAWAAWAADGKKGVDIVALEVSGVCQLADYFVICSGESNAQIKAIAGDIEATLKAHGHHRLCQKSDPSTRWQLLDYGDIVVHVLHPEDREFYQLEAFWSHAERLDSDFWQAVLAPVLQKQAAS